MDATQVTASVPAAPELTGSFLGMLGALCLILGIIFLGYWLMRRFGPSGLGLGRTRGAFSPALLGRLYLGNRQSVAVVRIQDKTLVLGVTESRINILTHLRCAQEFSTVLDHENDAARGNP